jgi:hypothetical protein
MMTSWPASLRNALWCIPLALLAAGCGDRDIGLIDAHGTVHLNDQPLADAEVVFELKSTYGTVVTRGQTDSQGKYRLRYADQFKGTFRGKQTVRIRAADEATQRTIPDRYHERSDLTVEVTEDGAPYDFHLSSLPADEP